jgi:hypothetical protein
MFTWFRRGQEFLRFEVRQALPGVYELTVMTPDGREATERFTNEQALVDRQQALQREFVAEGWTGPHGWNV